MSTLYGVGDSVGSAAEKVRVPLIGTAAAAGVAGAAALGSRALSRRHSNGIPRKSARQLRSAAGGVGRLGKDVGKLGKEIGEAGFRFGIGETDVEVRKSGSNSKSRQSPLEALLSALTSRRSVR
jgi:hypothetical protein